MKNVLVAIPYKSSLNRLLRLRMIELSARLKSPGYKIDIALYENIQMPSQIPFEPHALARNNLLLEYLEPEHDLVMWIDADLVDYPPDIIGMLDRANPGGITAPMVLIEGTGQFYDTYGFVEYGSKVSHVEPYFEQSGDIINMDAVGCAYLMPASLFHDGVEYSPTTGETEHYSICQQANQRGIRVACLTTMTVYHADLNKYGEGYHGH